jgi:CRISPR-associated protein (TIGR03984 family)
MSKPYCEKLDDIEGIQDTYRLRKWLNEKVQEHKLKYLLAHAEDGVIWGNFDSQCNLITSDEPIKLFPKWQFPAFRYETLQQCRVFCETVEIMFWKTDEGLKARIIKDKHLKQQEYITEYQILLGTHGEKNEDRSFTLLWDSKQGLKHAVPFTDIVLEKDGVLKNKVRLKVNHYIDYNDAGVAHIYLSRLVNLTAKEIKL